MKLMLLVTVMFSVSYCFSQEVSWVETEGIITEITVHSGKRRRESAIVKFKSENETEQLGSVELFRIPFLGSMKSVGDQITIHYDPNNPAIVKTTSGKFLSRYGMYILIFLGIIFSIKPFLKKKKEATKK